MAHEATWVRVSAQRFAARRMEHALVRRDVGLYDDPMRAHTQALLCGGLLGAVVVVVCVVLSFVAPRGDLGASPIVLVRESGALYVRVGDVWHPAPNLASARLIARTPADPTVVDQEALDRVRRGPRLGIPDAPASLGEPATWPEWTVCDGAETTVLVGVDATSGFDPARTVLVTPRGEAIADTFLLRAGHRARVDLREPAVVRALRLDGVTPVPVSRALLDTVPETAPISVPRIAGAGSAGPLGVRVGSVVQVAGLGGTDLYVVLRDGVQRIGVVAADVIRFAYAASTSAIPGVAPDAIAATAVVDRLALDSLPDHAADVVGQRDSVTVCARWRADGPATTVLVGAGLDADTTPLAQADGEGPRVDRVALPPGRHAYVTATRILGGDDAGPRYLVTDTGTIHGVGTDDAARALGLAETPTAAPWPVLAWLPRGPQLGVDRAAVAGAAAAP